MCNRQLGTNILLKRSAKKGDSRLKLSEESYSEGIAPYAKAAHVKEDLDLRL